MPDEDTYSFLLVSAVEEFYRMNKNRVFILVDAYDEFLSSQEFERATQEREKLRSILSLLRGTGCCAKILVTTRHHYRQELQDTFPGSIVGEIYGDLNDMRIYLGERLARSRLRQSFRDEILEKLLLENEDQKW
jgi:hypothetical protein